MTQPRDEALEASVIDTPSSFRKLPVSGLTGDWRFRRLKNKGKSGRVTLLNFRWIQAKSGVWAGIVVSKKVGNAVVRNRIRRRVREALRRMDLPACEIMIIANPDAANARYKDLHKAILAAARKAGLQ
jgi:ribonuclease P protein component